MLFIVFFFFFKQKTAYEMRISDWSSDVCSSDLCSQPACLPLPPVCLMPSKAYIGRSSKEPKGSVRQVRSVSRTIATWAHHILSFAVRSEEHTSELQSLMRISYAVFCLKKKINHYHVTRNRA